jgi:hypothetical protein
MRLLEIKMIINILMIVQILQRMIKIKLNHKLTNSNFKKFKIKSFNLKDRLQSLQEINKDKRSRKRIWRIISRE